MSSSRVAVRRTTVCTGEIAFLAVSVPGASLFNRPRRRVAAAAAAAPCRG
jgi:hypothetical protein